MEYYIKERNWKQILKFIKGIKGMDSEDEKRLRIFIEADGKEWLPVAAFTENLWQLQKNDLRDGAKRVFGRIYWNTPNKNQL